MRTGVEGCGVVVWFGKYTDIASLVLLFGLVKAYTLDWTLYCMYSPHCRPLLLCQTGRTAGACRRL